MKMMILIVALTASMSLAQTEAPPAAQPQPPTPPAAEQPVPAPQVQPVPSFVAAPPPATKLQAMLAATGTIIVKSYASIGEIAGDDRSSMRVFAVTVTDR